MAFLVTDPAPDFAATAVLADGSFDEEFKLSSVRGRYVVLCGTFLIDRAGIVRHALVNDTPLGRNVDEALRMVDALRFHEERGDVCPANWEKAQERMKPTTGGVVDYLSKYAR